MTTTVSSDLDFQDYVGWKCRDRRYRIRRKGTAYTPLTSISSRCGWSRVLSLTPADLECVLRYCDNATDTPNTNGANYRFTQTRTLIPLNNFFYYPCKSGHKIEQNVVWWSQAASSTPVKCKSDGEFDYPSPWPQCSSTVSCPDPGNSLEVTRTYTSDIKDLQYKSYLNWECEDRRKYIKLSGEADSALVASKTAMCQWSQSYPLDGTDLVCVIHHCRHPHTEEGSHQPPSDDLNLELVTRNWHVPFNDKVRYKCKAGTFVERAEPDPTLSLLDVSCVAGQGVYDTPVRQGGAWPNCTATVLCGDPPPPPVNGSRTWVGGAEEGRDTYNTVVTYTCQHGSQFDTDGDGLGDSLSIDVRCQWDKQWAPHPFTTDWTPYPDLPPCIVTHCVEPFKIPEETSLEEVTAADTPINTAKQYRCKDSWGSDHTPRMFWESDRSQSTFEISCQDTGYFTWREWPVCLTDVSCSPPPPEVPSHSEYSLSSDDGTVTINSLQYPVIPTETRTTDLVLDSTYNHSLIPRNFMANLTYRCGSAREFLDSDGNHQPSQNMTCQWDKTWTPTSSLDPCDWVSCLKPPTPPKSTNLRVSDWFGETIDFGQQVRFVCERGYFFEDDSSQIDVKFTCQDGKATGFEDRRGFFDVPQLETEWPRCVLGET